MTPETIAILPPGGYVASIKALMWMWWVGRSEGINIQHARNRGEMKIGKYKVDGICHETKQILEMNGCWWHACPSALYVLRTGIKYTPNLTCQCMRYMLGSWRKHSSFRLRRNTLSLKCGSVNGMPSSKNYHNDDERSLYGTYVSLELQKAVEMGYVVQRIDSVWHFSRREQYDPTTKTGGLFAEYILKD